MTNAGPITVVALEGAIADDTRGTWIDARSYPYLAAYVSGTGTINAGVVSFEEAYFDPNATPGGYVDTWSTLPTDFDVDATDLTGGAQAAVHFPVGKYAFVRPFIETAIGGGGAVSVVFVGTGPS